MERLLTTIQLAVGLLVKSGVEAEARIGGFLAWVILLLSLAFSGSAGAASPLRPPVSYFTGASGVLIYDFDGDGRKDVVQFSSSGLSVSLQRSDGLLQYPKSFPFSMGCNEQTGDLALGDLNRDGYPDLAIACWGAISIVPGGASGFGSPVVTSFGSIVFHSAQVVDWFEDGHYEVAATGTDYMTNAAKPQSYFVLLRLNADGTVTVLRNDAIPIEAWAFVDLRGDGVQDMVIGQYQANLNIPAGGLVIQRDTGTGFSAPEQYGDPLFIPSGLAIADINGDGRPDIVLGSASNSGAGSAGLGGAVEVLTQNADGTFTQIAKPTAGNNPGEIAVADLDGDGLPDIVVGNNGFQTFTVIRQTSPGQFSAIGTYLVPDMGANSVALAVADINSDGKPDVITGSSVFGQIDELDVWYNAAGAAYNFDPSVTYTVGPTTPVIGDAATFNVGVSNGGSTMMSDWTLTFTVPSLFKIDTIDNRCTYSKSIPVINSTDLFQNQFTCNVTLGPGQKTMISVGTTALTDSAPSEPDCCGYKHGGYAELAPFIYTYSTNPSEWASVPTNEQAFIAVTSSTTAPPASSATGGTGSTSGSSGSSGSSPGAPSSAASKGGGGAIDLVSSLLLLGLALIRKGRRKCCAQRTE